MGVAGPGISRSRSAPISIIPLEISPKFSEVLNKSTLTKVTPQRWMSLLRQIPVQPSQRVGQRITEEGDVKMGALPVGIRKVGFFERIKMGIREIVAILIAGITSILAIVLPRVLLSRRKVDSNLSSDAMAIINAIYTAMGIEITIEITVLTAIILIAR